MFYTDASVRTHSYLYIKTSRMHFHLTDFEKLIVEACNTECYVGCFSRNSKFSHKAMSLNINSILDEATGCKQV